MSSTSSSLNSFTRDQLPGAGLKWTCTRTASTYRYPNIRASDLGPARVRSAHCVRKFSLNFHRSGAPQLDVIGYLSFDRPRRSVLGPPGRWRGLIRVRVRSSTENYFPPRRGRRSLGNAQISHWSFRRVTRFESRSRGACEYTGCPPTNARL